MSIRPEAQLPFDRNEWFTLARTRLRWASTTRVDKLCGHTYCDLTQDRCCACIDTRAERTRYFRYVDGRGMVADAKRWHDYCPGCKIYHRSLQEATERIQGEEMSIVDEQERTDVEERIVCATCGERGHAMWDCPIESMDTETTSSSETSGSEATLPPPNLRLPIHSSSPQRISQTSPSRQQHCLYPPSRQRNSPSRTNPISMNHPTSSEYSLSSRHQPPYITSPSRVQSYQSRFTDHQARRARVREHFERSFGTISDIANDPDYISPIASLYGNAYTRFQERERERRERQSTDPDDTNTRNINHSQSINENLHDRYREHLIRTQQHRLRSQLERTRSSGQSPTRVLPSRDLDTQNVLETLRRQLAEDDRQLLATPESDVEEFPPPARESLPEVSQPSSVYGRWYGIHIDSDPANPSPRRDIPSRPKTPEPLPKEELAISNECKVCFSQHCDTLLLPCAHLALCEVLPGSLLLFLSHSLCPGFSYFLLDF